ncbi:DUF6285 domain-containing protein [Marinobacter orientalis]|uniref:Acyl-CoA dehydrogenase n=1 Tax=Marinobacter orientalis TaxID=1928859 RepID=A0A7Y0WRK0_9GAMM|nr:DUF6285 domain-containing protein [Marinobacter orientalis]NMT63158.1 acyl-CoA dehydrogenase [Marinobacter orientalis]TGX51815.1 acyl-CoA dehydrogenase [Marinobacter orientalis]
MINQPETRDLLAEARRVLLDSIAPDLGGERKYQALMIANAMAMAMRELEQREQGQPEETDHTVRAYLAEHSIDGTAAEAEADLARAVFERRLDGTDPALRSVLRTLTEARLRINNPGFLER